MPPACCQKALMRGFLRGDSCYRFTMILMLSRTALLLAITSCTCSAFSQEPTTTPSDQPCSQLKIAPTSTRLVLPEDQASGLLIHKVEVKYPGIARAARISGTVILQAAVTRNGEVSDIRPLCGPKILQEACIKAVRKWKYRPYLLNGEPVELETTITSVFRLGDPK